MPRRPAAQALESVLALLILAVAAGFALMPDRTAKPQPAPVSEKAAPATGEPFHDRLLEIARTYQAAGRVDDLMRWVPVMCRPIPGRVRFSASKDADTHGRKLYSVFAKDRARYVELAKREQPVGQWLVKESWTPEEVTEESVPKGVTLFGSGEPGRIRITPLPGEKITRPSRADHFDPYTRKDGKVYRAAKVAALFVMLKSDPKTPGTDDGWVYGTLSADGKQVTAAGRVESCMDCHRRAKHDRLFGLPDPVRR